MATAAEKNEQLGLGLGNIIFSNFQKIPRFELGISCLSVYLKLFSYAAIKIDILFCIVHKNFTLFHHEAHFEL